jgi:hypothetical protein
MAAGLLVLAACDDDGSEEGVASLDGSEADADTDAGPAGGATDPHDEDFQDAMLEYAQCMREQGIDMPDPDLDGGGLSIAGEANGGDFVEGSDEFMEAEEECGPILEDAVGEFERDPEAEAELLEQMTAVATCMP